MTEGIGPLDPEREYFHAVGGVAGHAAFTEDLRLAVSSIEQAADLVAEATTQVRTQHRRLEQTIPGLGDAEIPRLARLAEGAVERVVTGATGTARVGDDVRDIARRLVATVAAMERAEQAAFRRVSMGGRLVEGVKDAVGLARYALQMQMVAAEAVIPDGIQGPWLDSIARAVAPTEMPDTTALLHSGPIDALGSLMPDGLFRAAALLLAARMRAEELMLGFGTQWGVEPTGVLADRPVPQSGADLLRTVQATEELMDGSVTIQRVEGPEGEAWIVSIPGTQEWIPGPNAFDGPGAVQAAGRHASLAMETIVAAMEAAGIPPGAPVMLVGHSQGAYLAMALASSPAFTDRFAVSHVVTSGAGNARADIPPHIQTLHVEHPEDIVVGTDMAPPEDRPNQTTFRHDISHSSNPELRAMGQTILGAHHLDGYIATMELAESGVSTSVDHFMETASPFLTGETATTTAYRPVDLVPKEVKPMQEARPIDAAARGAGGGGAA